MKLNIIVLENVRMCVCVFLQIERNAFLLKMNLHSILRFELLECCVQCAFSPKYRKDEQKLVLNWIESPNNAENYSIDVITVNQFYTEKKVFLFV